MHLSSCIISLTPFAFTGERIYAIIPMFVWLLYNMLFLVGNKRANLVIPNFSKFRNSFQTSLEEFFSPK